MASDKDDRPTGPENRNSPAALLLGLVFIMALLGIALVHSARDVDSHTTAADPNAVTGSTGSSPPRK